MPLRSLLVDAAAEVAKLAPSLKEVVAHLVDLLNMLLHVANVTAAAVLAVAAAASSVVVAVLVELLSRDAGFAAGLAAGLAGASWAVLTVNFFLGSCLLAGATGLAGLALLLEARAVLLSVKVAAAVAVLALAVLLEVKALAARRGLDGVALRVFVLARLAIAAAAGVAERAADLGSFSHVG